MSEPSPSTIRFQLFGGEGKLYVGRSPFWFWLCLLIGLPFVYFFAIHVPIKWLRARTWIATPCTILSIDEQDDSAGHYQPKVDFEYVVDGDHYTSSQLKLINFSYRPTASGAVRDDLQRKYPPGSTHICYVNPRKPAEAILNRDVSLGEFFYLPFALLLTGVGVYGLRAQRQIAGRNLP